MEIGKVYSKAVLINMGYTFMGSHIRWSYWYNKDQVIKLFDERLYAILPHELAEVKNGLRNPVRKE